MLGGSESSLSMFEDEGSVNLVDPFENVLPPNPCIEKLRHILQNNFLQGTTCLLIFFRSLSILLNSRFITNA